MAMKISDILEKSVKNGLKKLGLEAESVSFEHPAELSHGDYSTNIALVLAKKEKKNPKELAEEILKNIETPKEVEKIEVAGAGFINFYLNKEFFAKSLEEGTKEDFGKNESLKGKKIILEYTDANPFKLFHIGHLMSNTIGETLSRLAEYTGGDVKRASYQGDVGMHVAMTLWGLQKENLNPHDVYDQGRAYAIGFKEYEESKNEIKEINKKLYEKSDEALNEIYKKGREASLEYFEEQYKKLGTRFDYYFFESETGGFGKEIIEENINLFEKSDGAVVFRGEDKGLHTRVFINSEGLPTYEAKELGLAKTKYEKFPYDQSYIITGNEINSYFQVLLEVMKEVYKKEQISEKTTHIGHGMLRLPQGKMSSRTGDVVTADTLLGEINTKILEMMAEREISNKKEIAEVVSIGALKYSILRQAIGKDVVFEFDKAISFEGDSGPYLQYAYVRTKSILEIAKAKNFKANSKVPDGWETTEIEKILYRFPEIIKRAWEEKSPQYVATFLIELASAFNSFYATEKIAEEGGEYKLLLTEAVSNTLEKGLYLLGIKVPERM